MNYDVCCEGGGVKLIGHIGALAAIENKGFIPSHMAGTSAGGMVVAFRQAGYDPAELKQIVFDINFSDFLSGAPLGTKIYHLLKNKGIYSTDKLYNFIKEKLSNKGVKYFGDFKTENKDLRWRYKLKLIASDISDAKMLVLPDDIKLYNFDPDYLEVAEAVRMSISIPGFFRPVKLGKNFIVDGGLLSNFPVWIFDSDMIPTWPTFGIILKEPGNGHKTKISNIIDFSKAIFKTMLDAHDRRFISIEDETQRLIKVPTGNISLTDFYLSTDDKNQLYHSGYKSAMQFFEGWNFENYVEWASRVRSMRNV